MKLLLITFVLFISTALSAQDKLGDYLSLSLKELMEIELSANKMKC